MQSRLDETRAAAVSVVRRGAAATELAIVAPVLVLFCVVCVDVGRVAHGYIALSNASRVGAEYGATHQFTAFTYPFWESQVREVATQELQSIDGFDGQSASLVVSAATQPDGLALVSVDVTYPFAPLISIPGLPDTIVLHRRVTMRQYQ